MSEMFGGANVEGCIYWLLLKLDALEQGDEDKSQHLGSQRAGIATRLAFDTRQARVRVLCVIGSRVVCDCPRALPVSDLRDHQSKFCARVAPRGSGALDHTCHFSSTAHPSSLAAARGRHTCSPGPCALPVHRCRHTRAHPRRARGLLDGAAHHRRTPQRRHRGDVLAQLLGPRSSAHVGSRIAARPPPRAVQQSFWMAVASAWARAEVERQNACQPKV